MAGCSFGVSPFFFCVPWSACAQLISLRLCSILPSEFTRPDPFFLSLLSLTVLSNPSLNPIKMSSNLVVLAVLLIVCTVNVNAYETGGRESRMLVSKRAATCPKATYSDPQC